MAERRMFAKTIIDSDAFLDMPISARLLYYDLGMRADDDGFVNSPKKIMRMVGASQDDLNILATRKFIIPFENGVVVIKHWRIHNYIRQDTYNETTYKEQKSMLELDENKAYRLAVNEPSTNRQLTGNEPETQDSIGKVRIGKDRIGEDLTGSKEPVCRTKDVRRIVDAWNTLGLNEVREVTGESKRGGMLRARVKEHGVDGVLEAIENVRKSDFLKGQNAKGFVITFDWFVKPNNFIKVLEGNYNELHERDTSHGNSRKPKQYTTAENYKPPKAPDTVQDLWDKVNKI